MKKDFYFEERFMKTLLILFPEKMNPDIQALEKCFDSIVEKVFFFFQKNGIIYRLKLERDA